MDIQLSRFITLRLILKNPCEALVSSQRIALSVLLQRLEDQDNSVRSSAAQALGSLGNASEAVISVLLQRLEDQDNSVRSSAVQALGNLGNASAAVLNALLLRLKDRDESVPRSAAQALGNLGNASEAVISALLLRLEDRNDFVMHYSAAAAALGKLSLKSSEVLPAVVQWIDQHEDTEYVGSGIDVLWDLVAGEGNRSAVGFYQYLAFGGVKLDRPSGLLSKNAVSLLFDA